MVNMKTPSVLNNPVLVAAARLVLGMVFLVAAVAKIADPDTFAKSIIGYEMLPYGLTNLVALFIPWLEVICGLFVIFGVRLRVSAGLILGMLLVFTTAIVIAVLQGKELSCGCFGDAGDAKIGWPKVLENVGLILLALYIVLFPNDRIGLVPQPDSHAQQAAG